MPVDAVDDAAEICPVCDGTPRVLVAIRHTAMRAFTLELIRREHSCWEATALEDGELLAGVLRRINPDVLVVDDGDFPSCCQAAIAAFPRSRVVVVGTEPDHAYRAAAFRAGAGAWVAREDVGEQLGPVMRQVLGCAHGPCPPGVAQPAASGLARTAS